MHLTWHMGRLSTAILPRPGQGLPPAHAAAAGLGARLCQLLLAVSSNCSAVRQIMQASAKPVPVPTGVVSAQLCRRNLCVSDRLASPPNAVAIANAWLAAVSPGSCPSARHLHVPDQVQQLDRLKPDCAGCCPP